MTDASSSLVARRLLAPAARLEKLSREVASTRRVG
jgi:hypothetical protein